MPSSYASNFPRENLVVNCNYKMAIWDRDLLHTFVSYATQRILQQQFLSYACSN